MKGVSNEWKRGDRVTFYEEQKHKERRGENQRGTEDEQRERWDAVIVGIHKPSWVHWTWTSTVIFKLPHSLSLLNRTKMFKKWYVIFCLNFRCCMDAINQLPAEYLKVLYSALLDLFSEIESDMGKQGLSYALYYVKEAVRIFLQAHAFFFYF